MQPEREYAGSEAGGERASSGNHLTILAEAISPQRLHPGISRSKKTYQHFSLSFRQPARAHAAMPGKSAAAAGARPDR